MPATRRPPLGRPTGRVGPGLVAAATLPSGARSSAPEPRPSEIRSPSARRWAAVAVLATLSFVPLASMISGGVVLPDYPGQAMDWVVGGVLSAVLGLVFAWAPWPSIAASPPLARRVVWLAAAAALTLYIGVAWGVFWTKPLNIDEFTQLMQARVYASGRLWDRVTDLPEFFSS